MLTINLPYDTEQLIITTAKEQGVSVDTLIAQAFAPINFDLVQMTAAINAPTTTVPTSALADTDSFGRFLQSVADEG